MRLSDLRGRRVAVWGASYGVEVSAAVELLPALAEPASIEVVLDGGDLGPLATADVVVKSPGVSRYRPEAQPLLARGALTGGMQLLLAEHADRTLAVTGSKGKSTTTSLAHHLVRALAPGDAVEVGGNLGRAPLRLLALDPMPDRLVVEVSSFQAAEALDRPAVGILTALFPDHLDWHGSYERYLADKLQLFRGAHHAPGIVAVDALSPLVDELPGAVAFGGPGGWHVAAGMVRRASVPAFPIAVTPLPGEHNQRNLCAVLTAVDAWGLDPLGRVAEVVAALESFRPLPHRLDPVGEVDGMLCVDDSMSSNPDAAIAAVAAFPGRPLTIILGGASRDVPFDGLAAAIAARTDPTVVVHVPETGPAMATAIAAVSSVPCLAADDLAAAVAAGRAHTPPGGVLLLSPGAPSFTEFTDYRARAARFRQLLGLPEARSELT